VYSPDRRWWWNGRDWVPAPPAGRRLPVWVLPIGVIALLGLGVCSAWLTAFQQKPPSTACAPRPCATVNGFSVHVVSVDWAHPAPFWLTVEPGSQLAQVTLSFENVGRSEQHADPFQFVLQDELRVKHAVVLGVDGWQGVNLAPGGTFGPRSIDFMVASGTASGVLVWHPDFRDHPITLSPA
jgi:hypothetical protein